MDDLQFRRSIYADPNSTDEDILSAMAADPSKKKFAQEINELDDKISAALNIPVPDDLGEKLILRQSLASHQQQKRKQRVHLALAASVAVVMGLTFSFMQFSHAYNSVGDYAIAHVNHEAQYFDNNSQARVSLASLNQKMASFNGSFTDGLGELLSADYCRFDGMKSLHLVFKGQSSPVNIFVVPNSEHLAFSAEFSDKELQGLVDNFNQSNIIVVGDKNEPIKNWQDKINRKVRWST